MVSFKNNHNTIPSSSVSLLYFKCCVYKESTPQINKKGKIHVSHGAPACGDITHVPFHYDSSDHVFTDGASVYNNITSITTLDDN